MTKRDDNDGDDDLIYPGYEGKNALVPKPWAQGPLQCSFLLFNDVVAIPHQSKPIQINQMCGFGFLISEKNCQIQTQRNKVQRSTETIYKTRQVMWSRQKKIPDNWPILCSHMKETHWNSAIFIAALQFRKRVLSLYSYVNSFFSVPFFCCETLCTQLTTLLWENIRFKVNFHMVHIICGRWNDTQKCYRRCHIEI